MNGALLIFGSLDLLALALGCNVFVLLYWRGFRWTQTALGQNMMTLFAGMAAVLDLAFVRPLIAGGHLAQHCTPEDPVWFLALRVAVFTTVTAAVWWRDAILIAALARAYRERAATERSRP